MAKKHSLRSRTSLSLLETSFATAACLLAAAATAPSRDRSPLDMLSWNGDTYVLYWNYEDDRLYTQLNGGTSIELQISMQTDCMAPAGVGRLRD